MSGAMDLSREPRLVVEVSFVWADAGWIGISGWLPAGFCEGGRCLVGRGPASLVESGGTEAGTKVGASGCNLVSWPPNDLPPVTVLSCNVGLGFARLSL
jgi:hypothetical protein